SSIFSECGAKTKKLFKKVIVMETDKKYDYDAIEAGYYDKVFKKQRGVQSKWHDLKFSYLCGHLGEYRHHLDIGCGAGTLISLLDQNKRSTGVDVAQDQIHYAQSHYATALHDFIKIQSSQGLPFADNTFDMVTLVETIEHLTMEENRNLFKEIRRVLQPQGRIILTTPN